MLAPSSARPFDLSRLKAAVQELTWIRARACLRVAPVQALTWEWKGDCLLCRGLVRDPDNIRHEAFIDWDGNLFYGSCSCQSDEDLLCPHAAALGIHLFRADPWRQEAPPTWQLALDYSRRSPSMEPGDQRFVFRVDLRARLGSPVGHLRIRLSRARLGRRGLGQETPFPAGRIKGTTLEAIPHEERSLLSWLVPMQGWNLARNAAFTTDPRYLDVPPTLVETCLVQLARVELCFIGDTEIPLALSDRPFYFSLRVYPGRNGALHFTGQITEQPEAGRPIQRSDGAVDGSSLPQGPADEVLPDLLVGELPCLAWLDNRFHRVVGLDRVELWQLSGAGGIEVPYRDLPSLLEHYVEPLRLAGLLSAEALAHAMPEALTGLVPTGLLTLEEVEGRLVAHLAFRYGPDAVISAESGRTVEEVDVRGRSLLIHRNIPAEEVLESRLLALGLQIAAPGRFETAGDAALHFLVEHLPALLRDGWHIEGEERLERYRPSRVPIRLRGAITTGVSWFDLELEAVHGDTPIPMSTLFEAWRSGRRFVRFGDGVQAMLPEDWLERNRSLIAALSGTSRTRESGDDSSEEKDRFRLPAYYAPLLDDLWEGGASIEADEGWYSFSSALRHFDGIHPVPIPAAVNAELRTYQTRGVDWLCFLRDHGLGGVLADDMGLGKTLQTLALLQIEKERRRGDCLSLVIAPTSVLFNWRNEAARFVPELRVIVLQGPDRHASVAELQSADLVVTSYALLRRDLSIHLEMDYHYVILDEAQWVKNPESLTAGAVRSIKARHRLTLTGTPIENRLSEIWSQFAFLMPGFLPDLRRFVQEFVLPIERDHDQRALDELRKRIHPFVLRRLKEEVASELPPRTDNVLFCELSGAQRRLYDAVLVASRERVQRALEERGAGQGRITVLDALLKLRQICCHPQLVHLPEALHVRESAKLELFTETLTEILSEGHRVLVFSQFVEMLSILRASLEAQGILYEYLDGRTRDRMERVDRFNAESAPVFLISLKAGGTGLNLASADYVIHYDPWWNPAVEEQATDRAYRIGQTRPVFSYKLIARDTVEEKILELQKRKRDLADQLLSSEGGFGKQLSAEDLLFLFE